MAYLEGDDLKYEVVWSANEDVTGVHELLWSANTWWPDKPASERLRLAEDAIEWALGRGLITLHYDYSAESRALAAHEIPQRLREWQTWAILEGPALFFWRTDAGEEWIRTKPVPRSWAERGWINVDPSAGEVDYPDLS